MNTNTLYLAVILKWINFTMRVTLKHFFILVSILGLTNVSLAQKTKEYTDASSLFEHGKMLYLKKQYVPAIKEFQSFLGTTPGPNFEYEANAYIGLSRLKLDKNGSSRNLSRFVRKNPESVQKKRNVLEVLINANDQLLVEKQLMTIDRLRQKTKDHLTNEGRDPNLAISSTKAIVSLKNDRGTSYDIYVQVYNELTAAYNEVRNDYSMQEFGRLYSELSPNRDQAKIKEVKTKYPKKLSEAEPVSLGGK